MQPQFKNNCLTEMCSGFEEGSYSKLIDFVSLDSRIESNKVIKKVQPLNHDHNPPPVHGPACYWEQPPPTRIPRTSAPPPSFKDQQRGAESMPLSLARSLTRMARNLLYLAPLARSLEGLVTCCLSPLFLASLVAGATRNPRPSTLRSNF